MNKKAKVNEVTVSTSLNDRCECGHIKDWHFLGSSLGENSSCKYVSCSCEEFILAKKDTSPVTSSQVFHQVSLTEVQMDRLYLGSNINQKIVAIQALLNLDREEKA